MAQVVVPRFIESPEDFRSVVALGSTPESLVLEFKSEIDNWKLPKGVHDRDRLKREAQKQLCRDIAQFANTFGGCLAIGVSEGEGERHRVADTIKPVTDVDKLKAWIEDAIKNFLVPWTFTHDVRAINLGEGTILAINIPPSRTSVALYDDQTHTIEYLHRTSHGKDWMNPDEVERHIMNGSRAAKIAFQNARDRAHARRVMISGDVWFRPQHGDHDERATLSGFPSLGNTDDDPDVFEVVLPVGRIDRTVRLPYGVIREVWVDAQGAMHLLLSVRLILTEGGEMTVEPY